ncbi:hypothetical protein PO909_023027 [Leuciscus waleckii]
MHSLFPQETWKSSWTIMLLNKLNSIHGDVSLTLPVPTDKPTHNFVPNQQVLIRSLKSMKGEPKYL